MYRLATDVHACLVGETPVVLDTAVGRYQLVRGETGRHLTAFLRNEATATMCAALAEAGLLESSPCAGERQIKPEKPNYAHLQNVRFRQGWALLPFAVLLLLMALTRVRRIPLRTLLAELHAEAARPLGQPKWRISEARIAATFCLAQRILPLENQCIPHSVATAQMMRLFGHRPTIIIGVRLPIAAHCWVQCEHRLLGDTLDTVEGFQPILAI